MGGRDGFTDVTAGQGKELRMLAWRAAKTSPLAPNFSPSMTKPQPPQDTPAVRKSDKDLPLIQDIRLLGRILGDVIRDQDGVAAFD